MSETIWYHYHITPTLTPDNQADILNIQSKRGTARRSPANNGIPRPVVSQSRTLAMSLRSLPCPMMGAWASSGYTTRHCPGRTVK